MLALKGKAPDAREKPGTATGDAIILATRVDAP
jgi:hypothetical protein